MGLARAGHRLGDRLRPHRRRVGRRPVPDLGRAAPDVPGRPLRPLRRRLAADPPRRRRGDRLRHRALHVAEHRRERAPASARARRRRASRRRSRRTRRSTRARAGCCCRRSPRRRSTSSSRRRARTARSWSTACAGTTSSTRAQSTTPSTSRCGSSPTCSACPQEDADLFRGFVQPRPRGRGAAARAARGRESADALRVPRRRRSTTTSPTRATTSHRTCSTPSSTGEPLDADPRRRHHRAAAHRRHRHDVERHRRVALAPRRTPRPTASGSSPNRTCCPIAMEELLRGLRAGHDGPAGQARTSSSTAAR